VTWNMLLQLIWVLRIISAWQVIKFLHYRRCEWGHEFTFCIFFDTGTTKLLMNEVPWNWFFFHEEHLIKSFSHETITLTTNLSHYFINFTNPVFDYRLRNSRIFIVKNWSARYNSRLYQFREFHPHLWCKKTTVRTSKCNNWSAFSMILLLDMLNKVNKVHYGVL
jgi:hypothetical protein